MTSGLEAAVLRTVAWFMVVGYTPLRQEVVLDLDVGSEWEGRLPTKEQTGQAISDLIAQGSIVHLHSRLVLPGSESLFEEQARRERVFPRKWRRIQKLVGWLRFVPSIRFLAVCNTTALGSARDMADIDLFLVVREGTVWITRGFLSLCAAFAFRRPGQRRGEQDAWCFSFFIDDSNLDLERFALPGEDPYLRFWIRHLLPILDDGIGRRLWDAQRFAFSRNPLAESWLSWRKTASRSKSVPSWLKRLDVVAMNIQKKLGSKRLWQAAANADSDVVLDTHTFKTHMQDRRKEFRMEYEALCKKLDINA